MLARHLINYLLAKRSNKKYLEIGLYRGMTFNNVYADIKHSVDPDEEANATFKMTSDEFFQNVAPTLNLKYDVIFIDGLHYSDQVDKDISNSLNYLEDDGVVILHDCNPQSEMRQRVPPDFDIWQYGWNGDVWKSIAKFRKNNSHLKYNTFVVNSDEGLGVIQNNSKGIELTLDLPENMDYDYFVSHREQLLNLKSVSEFHLDELNRITKSYLNYWGIL